MEKIISFNIKLKKTKHIIIFTNNNIFESSFIDSHSTKIFSNSEKDIV